MSSAVDEDTVRAVNAGRETLGAIFSSAQAHLQKVFIVFIIGFMGTFYALRMYIWDFLEATATAEMAVEVSQATDIITRTPFEVILLQAKIGMLIGIIFALPALLYYSRDALRRRGVRSAVPVSRGYLAALVVASLALFWGGVAYAYGIFFPFAFNFLGEVAYNTGVKPSWGITEFTEFVALLTLSFGLAAQLPLAMGVLSYTEIVPYELFRDKWRHAIVALTAFGAVFSPPDPFTLIMWAMPLVILYVFSLGLAKLVSNTRRRGAAEIGSGTGLMKRRVLQFVAVLLAVFGLVVAALEFGATDYLEDEVVPLLPGSLTPPEPTTLTALIAEHGLLGELAVGAIFAGVVGLLVLVGFTIRVLQAPVYPREGDLRAADEPDDVDFDVLDEESIAEVPAIVFEKMEEDEALDVARQAMYDDDRGKAQAILDRFDAIHEGDEAADDGEEAGADGPTPATAAGAGADGDGDGGVLAGTAAGMLDPFTEDETTEEDIGGYAYDIAFVVDSLTSRLIYIVAVFMAVLAGGFFWLYTGGLGTVLGWFVDGIPDQLLREVAERNGAQVDPSTTTDQLLQQSGFVIALHPVEVLIFIVKVSTLAAIVSILPMVLYFGWPAAKERGLVRGDRRTFLVWGGGLLAGFAAGTYLGFFHIAPAIISYLVTDAITNGMVISYRIKSFFWLVIYTTIGVGFLLNIVVTMALFHAGGIVHYRSMLRRWRPAVVGIFVISALVSPKGVLTMLLFAIPLALTYLLGLGLLYVLTAGGRLFGGGGGGGEPAPDAEGGATPE